MSAPAPSRSLPLQPAQRALANLPVRLKLAALGLISALVLLALAAWLLWLQDQAALASRRTALRQNVETAASVLQWAHGLETRGVLGAAQAQALALALQVLKGARYGGAAYLSKAGVLPSWPPRCGSWPAGRPPPRVRSRV